MKRYGIILLALLLQACSKPDQAKIDQAEKKDVPARYQATYLSADQMPNEKTQYLKIRTKDMPDNQSLLENLDQKLQMANFILETEDDVHKWTLNDCDQNRIIQVDGEGMRRYSVTRTVAMPDHAHQFPEFMILVFEFQTAQEAHEKYNILDNALLSGGKTCNGKSPSVFVENGNEIFYFTTPKSEYFSFIQQYANDVNSDKNSGSVVSR